MKKEIWRKYPKLPNRFKVSSTGRIKSIRSGRVIKTSIDRYGYERIAIIVGSRTDSSRRTVNLKVHTMVAETFIGKPKSTGFSVNHKDFNKWNNNIDNLEWVTIGGNTRHAWKGGRFNFMYGNKYGKKNKNEDIDQEIYDATIEKVEAEETIYESN